MGGSPVGRWLDQARECEVDGIRGGDLGHAREVAECHGGGLVHIEVVQTAYLLGTISANGWNTRMAPFITLNNAGGGSGGGIFIAAERMVGAPGTRLRVRGGDGSPDGGAGAGGRIALWTRVGGRTAPFALASGFLLRTDQLPAGFNALPMEALDVSGSTSGCNPGGDGTYAWVEGPPQGTLLLLR